LLKKNFPNPHASERDPKRLLIIILHCSLVFPLDWDEREEPIKSVSVLKKKERWFRKQRKGLRYFIFKQTSQKFKPFLPNQPFNINHPSNLYFIPVEKINFYYHLCNKQKKEETSKYQQQTFSTYKLLAIN